MKKTRLILILFIGILPAFAQEEVMKKYASTIDQAEMKEVLTILASDALEGRETGKRGQKMAAAFIASYFQEIGLTPVVPTSGGLSYYQKFNLESSKSGLTYIKLGDKTYANGEEVLYYGTANLNAPKPGQTVFVGKGTDEEYALVKTDGKVVLVDGSEGFFQQWKAARDKAFAHGAVLAIIIAKNTDKDYKSMVDHYGGYFKSSRLGFKSEDNVPVNGGAFLVGPSTAAALVNSTREKMTKAIEDKKLNKIKGTTIEYLSTRETTTVETENILGYLEGTDKKEELVLVTGHYDHLGKHNGEVNNGADDDGSGTTSVLKIAKAFAQAKKEGHGPRRSMLFMTVTGEEKGLLGSEYYVNHPIFPLDNTVVDLNIDMIGRYDDAHKDNREFVYVVGSDKLSSELDELSKKANDEFTKLDLDYKYNDENDPSRIYYRSDHWNFAKNNIPIIFYFSGIHEDYHRPTDTVDKIEFDLLQKRAQLVFYTAWVIANRNNRLVVDKPQQESVGQH